VPAHLPPSNLRQTREKVCTYLFSLPQLLILNRDSLVFRMGHAQNSFSHAGVEDLDVDRRDDRADRLVLEAVSH
jgi:hypothetical protein